MPATSVNKLLGRMADLSKQTPQKDFIGLFYGPPGAGKTTFVVDLAHQLTGKQILFVDSSDGWVSLENIEGLTDGVFRLEYETLDDLMGIINALKKKAPGFENFGAIVIDELSSVFDNVLDTVVTQTHGADGEVSGSDYRPTAALIMKALNGLHDIDGLHVIVVAHTRTDVDHRKVIVTSPGFSPKLGLSVAKIMHVIGYVTSTVKGAGDKQQFVREVQLQPSMLVSAKSRVKNTPFKLDVLAASDFLAGWVDGGTIAADLNEPEEQIEAIEDELPEDGIPAADVVEDDEPDYVEEA